MSRVGRQLIWEVPSGPGVVSLWPFYTGNDTGQVPMEAAEAPGCVCLAEFHRGYPYGNAPAVSMLTSRKLRLPLRPLREPSSRAGKSQTAPRKGCWM